MLLTIFIVSCTMIAIGVLATLNPSGYVDSTQLRDFGFAIALVGMLGVTHTSTYKMGELATMRSVYDEVIDVERYALDQGWEREVNTSKHSP